MKRAMVFILVSLLGVLPVLSPLAHARPVEVAPVCCCSDAEGDCPLCTEVPRQRGACPCAPAPQRPTSPQNDAERPAPLSQSALVRKVARLAQRHAAPELPLWLVQGLRPSLRLGEAVSVAALAPPQRAALCVWTT